MSCRWVFFEGWRQQGLLGYLFFPVSLSFIILQSALRQVCSLFQREFSTGRDLMQGCQTCDTRAQSGTQKDFLGALIHCCPNISISFARPASLYCAQYVYIHTHLTVYRLCMNYRWCQIILQWNIFTQIGAVRSVDWIFIVGTPAWRRLGEYVTLGRAFYSILLVTGRIRDIGQNVLQSSFGNWANTWHWTERFTVFFWWLGEYVTLDRTFYSLLLVTVRIRDIGQNVLQSSFGNCANTWPWTEGFTVLFW